MNADGATPAPALLDFDQVTLGYRTTKSDVEIVSELSFSVRPGTRLVLNGRSGSGKTTVLMSAMGLHAPWSGTVSWTGVDVATMDDGRRADARREHIGIVLQDGGLLDGLSALENVLLPVLRRRARPRDRERALDALAQVGMRDRATHPPDRLSGGEAQRVAIARALFLRPKLLVVDEPTASLDRRAADSVIGLLVHLTDSGTGLLVASHDPHVVEIATETVDVEGSSESRV